MANEKFIIDGERVIQQSPDGTYKEVTLQTDKDNNVVTSNGIILDENNTIEAPFPITDKLMSEPGYRMPFHGSFITFSGRDLYGSFKELQQKESEFRDPSENFLNNLTTGFIGLAKQGIIKGLGQVGQLLFGKPGTGSLMSKLRTLANMPRKDLAKKLGQEVVKGGISLGVDTAVDAASKAATGKTVGEHTANVLSTVTGLDVPTWVGDLASPTQWIGYGSLNKLEREVLPFLPGRYNQTIPGKVFPQNYLKATIRENGINYVPTQTSIDQAINHMGKDAQFVVTNIKHTGLVKPTEMLKETKEAAKETMKRLKKEGAYVPWNFRFRDDLYEWLPLEYTYYDKNGIKRLYKTTVGGLNYTNSNVKFARKLPKKGDSEFTTITTESHEGVSHATDRFVPKHIWDEYRKFLPDFNNNVIQDVRATSNETKDILRIKFGKNYYKELASKMASKNEKERKDAIESYLDALWNTNGYGKQFMINQKGVINPKRLSDGTWTYTIDWSGDMSKLLDFFKTLPLM